MQLNIQLSLDVSKYAWDSNGIKPLSDTLLSLQIIKQLVSLPPETPETWQSKFKPTHT